IYIVRSDRYDFKWRFFNSDGSEAEMCGNGSRCAARFALLNNIAGEHMIFETIAGPVSADVSGRMVKVLMPAPKGLKTGISIPLDKGWESVDFINTGVPHVVVQVKDIENIPVHEQGRFLRYHQLFQPGGANANFMCLMGKDQICVRTYERGVENETLACGTGSIASSLIANVKGLVSSPVTVITRGGEELRVHFEKKGPEFSRVWLEGGTSIIYKGELHEEAL
ncbi:MAG: diaminopimelate epimerase, partial [Deltaproteobacteria bacterium]|nr:diaminopimelate epimerase [Deltaproteobacteria bacterium]